MGEIKEIRARVITQEKGYYRISDGNSERLAEVSGKYRYTAAAVSDYPAVGDFVVATWPEDGSNSIIESLFPRKSAFIRKDPGDDIHGQIIAANIDTVFVCMSLNNNYNLRRLERYIAVAWDSGAAPVVVLTKADLCSDIDAKIAEIQSVAAGVDVVAVSSLNDDFEAVKAYLLPGKTVAFLGSSGVGKSTLINKLLGEELIATSEIRNDDRGRHTTTHRELITLPNGASVIDTPGMRELGMWDNEEGIETVFSDIEALTAQCRFADCTHKNEPGCAVREALKDGILDEGRWNSYLKLKTENEFAANESAYLEAKRTKFKEISKINKANFRKGR